jgi:hypothetical protein
MNEAIANEGFEIESRLFNRELEQTIENTSPYKASGNEITISN